jgi:signal peptidase
VRVLRLLGILLTGLFGLLLVCQIALAATMALASHTGYRVMVITGGSMEPTYHLGSALLLKDVADNEVTVGDAVTYSSIEGTLTTHRVIAMPHQRGVQYLQTQGDANAKPDPNYVNVAAVVGTPIAHLPYAGYVTSFLFSPLGRLLVFGPPLAALLMVQVRLIRAALRRNTTLAPASAANPALVGPAPAGPALAGAAVVGRGRTGLALVPTVVVVLVGSALAGTLVARSAATFTATAASTNSTISTAITGPPTALSADRVNGRNTLTWTAPAWQPADGYRIYRATSAGQPYTQIAQVPTGQTSYADAGGNANSVYQVRSVSGATISDPAGPVGVK